MVHKRYLVIAWRMYTSHLSVNTPLSRLRIRLTRMTGNTMLRWPLKLESKCRLSVMTSLSPTQPWVHSFLLLLNMISLSVWLIININICYAEGGKGNPGEVMQCSSAEGMVLLILSFTFNSLSSMCEYITLVFRQVNQIGSVTESIEAVKMSKRAGWGVMTSHRRYTDMLTCLYSWWTWSDYQPFVYWLVFHCHSGETEDTFIADLAVGLATVRFCALHSL